ncbi:cytochrome P450 [Embleya sp. AB8]
MSPQDEHGRAFTDDEVCDQIATLMIGGIPATADLLAWTFRVLSANGPLEQRLHAELDAVLVAGRTPAYDDIPRLPHLGRVLTETLCLYLSVSVVSRQVTQPVVLDGVSLSPATR